MQTLNGVEIGGLIVNKVLDKTYRVLRYEAVSMPDPSTEYADEIMGFDREDNTEVWVEWVGHESAGAIPLSVKDINAHLDSEVGQYERI